MDLTITKKSDMFGTKLRKGVSNAQDRQAYKKALLRTNGNDETLCGAKSKSVTLISSDDSVL